MVSDLPAYESYDPEHAPDSSAWLDVDEGVRMEFVEEYHRRRRIRLPNVVAHAAIHVIVENQSASAEQVVLATMARLRKDGLSRHDAIHAVGSVLIGHLNAIMARESPDPSVDPNEPYFEELKSRARAGSVNMASRFWPTVQY